MGYWYCRAEISEEKEIPQLGKKNLFGQQKTVTKTIASIIKGKVIGIGNTGFYGSHPCYIVVTREGKNPQVENVLIDSSQTSDCIHKILELRWVK